MNPEMKSIVRSMIGSIDHNKTVVYFGRGLSHAMAVARRYVEIRDKVQFTVKENRTIDRGFESVRAYFLEWPK